MDVWMDGWMDGREMRTGVGKVLVVLLRAGLALLEVLVLDFDKLHHFGGCVCVCVCVCV
jgi:hypothetical protein